MSTNGNGNVNRILLVLVSLLAGMVISGGGMMIRGDFLGQRAAKEVEQRLTERMNREYTVIREQLDRIERKVDEGK